MAVASAQVVLICLVLSLQALEQRPQLEGRSKRDPMASMVSFFSNVERRLTALEASWNNSTEERLAQVEGRIEGEVAEKLQTMQDAKQRMETMMNIMAEKMAKMVEAKANATEESAASLEATKTEPLSSSATDVSVPPQYRRTCQDYYDNGQRSSGVYKLQLEDGLGPMEVYCDMDNAPGWVVFQRRQDGSVDFYRSWKTYEYGFGVLSGEFWLGNRNIHRLTSAGMIQLKVDLQAWNGSTAFASYSHFSVGDASSSYKMSVSGYSGTAGDSLGFSNRNEFSTFDLDLDTWSHGNCAQDRKGAWWYADCSQSNLNGEYGTRNSSGYQYAWWGYSFGTQSLQRTELKLK